MLPYQSNVLKRSRTLTIAVQKNYASSATPRMRLPEQVQTRSTPHDHSILAPPRLQVCVNFKRLREIILVGGRACWACDETSRSAGSIPPCARWRHLQTPSFPFPAKAVSQGVLSRGAGSHHEHSHLPRQLEGMRRHPHSQRQSQWRSSRNSSDATGCAPQPQP